LTKSKKYIDLKIQKWYNIATTIIISRIEIWIF